MIISAIILTTTVALYMLAAGLIGGLAKALSPDSTWLPWSVPAPVRAFALAILVALQTGVDNAATGAPLGEALLVALATSALGWGVLLWKAVAAVVQASREINKLIVFAVFWLGGCALNPHPVSPCDGLYCVSVAVPGVPGTELVCWDSQARAEQTLAARGCAVTGTRAVCR